MEGKSPTSALAVFEYSQSCSKVQNGAGDGFVQDRSTILVEQSSRVQSNSNEAEHLLMHSRRDSYEHLHPWPNAIIELASVLQTVTGILKCR